ncbi:MoaA/NifB/PqqE/SkfB family radical SAM enzyme [Anaerospora hongkongensis]|uniref:MoaA/NifB/PqqE/SkfB family radical SAM enzyme n=1 Tax=Anaerospora hongkongensis TaxID=244830 RepID=A0A4R1PVF1_9FIRM|nr:radical SAM/SPASM domain-containing protein [Anaerospora hongkongensis]TCL36127.1 MoaA/NifB/PqqE/SkfB family radical SAM enzyme [Anaerospora hongkongensis]
MAICGIKGETKRIQLEDHIPLKTPLKVLLEASSICNFRCSFCPHGNGEAAKLMPQGIMPVSLAQKCIDDLAAFPDKVKTLAFVSFGEPLVNKNLEEIIQYAREKEVSEKLEITTNASLLTRERSEKLLDAGITLINISIYGLNTQQYKEFSDVSIDFERLVQNIEYLYSLCQNTQVVVKISDAVCNSATEREEFYRIFSPICHKMCIEHAVPLWYELHGSAEDGSRDIYGNPACNKEICPLPFFTMSINSNGVISPCCNDWQNRLVMGDASHQSLLSIWNGKEYLALRKKLLAYGNKGGAPCCNCRYHELVAMDNIDPFREVLLKRLEEKHAL